MAIAVNSGALLTCTMGIGLSKLTALRPQEAGGQPLAAVTDFAPGVNIPPFGMCHSPTNPAFISATAAAFGTPTPVPCTPAIAAPWAPGAVKVKVGGIPAVTSNSKCVCTLGGNISVLMPGTALTVSVS